MSYFEVDGVRHLPFGAGSGDRIVRDFGLPNLIRFPIVADLSLAGDGKPSIDIHLLSPRWQLYMRHHVLAAFCIHGLPCTIVNITIL